MFSGLGNWLERSDEDFLKDLYTDAGRRYKLENLRRGRLKAWRRMVVGLTVFTVAGLLCVIGLIFFVDTLPANSGVRLGFFLLLAGAACVLELISLAFDFERIDGQIKTLLLVAQLNTD